MKIKKLVPLLLSFAITLTTFAEQKPTLPKFEESHYVQYKNDDALLIYPNYNRRYIVLGITVALTATS